MINNPKEVQLFLIKWLKKFSIDPNYYFFNVDRFIEENVEVVISLGENKYDDERIIRDISSNCGVSQNDILSMNDYAFQKWIDKYPFLSLRGSFVVMADIQRNGSENVLGSTYKKLKEAKLLDDLTTKKIDDNEIWKRVESTIDELDKMSPGIRHSGAKIINLKYENETIVIFKLIKEMTLSYMQMYRNAENLFFQALKRDLTNEEKMELSLILFTLQLRDSASNMGLNMSILKKLIPLYREEGYTSFSSYVSMPKLSRFRPWECLDFLLDRDLVQEFVTLFPETKNEMREYMMHCSHYRCFFNWSDDVPELPDMIKENLDSFDEEILPWLGYKDKETFIKRNLVRESICVYIALKDDELIVSNTQLNTIKKMFRPQRLGGLDLPQIEKVEDSLSRRFLHMEAIGIPCRSEFNGKN